MADWYRKQSWTKNDEDDFFTRLGRTRKDSRAQYLRIQAVELIYTKNDELLSVAEMLLNKVLTDYSDDNFEKSSTLNSLGNIYEIKQDFEKAIEYYKRSIDFEKIYPRVQTTSYLSFSELVVKTHKSELFDFVENLLASKINAQIFPVEKYKLYSILSIINKEKKQLEKAKYYAALAEDNANAETSGLRYHKNLGVVNERGVWLDTLVKS